MQMDYHLNLEKGCNVIVDLKNRKWMQWHKLCAGLLKITEMFIRSLLSMDFSRTNKSKKCESTQKTVAGVSFLFSLHLENHTIDEWIFFVVIFFLSFNFFCDWTFFSVWISLDVADLNILQSNWFSVHLTIASVLLIDVYMVLFIISAVYFNSSHNIGAPSSWRVSLNLVYNEKLHEF